MRLGGGYYNPNQSQASLPGPGAGAGGNHPYHQPYTASHAPSVYSLDSGVGAYNGRRASAETSTATGDILAGDEYGADEFSGAVGELGLGPPPVGMNKSNPAVRALRTASSTSEISLHRTPTTSIGSSRAKRKGISAAIDVTKPPYTKEFVDDYRARMKLDPDPEAQFAFAKYLIEAARKVGEDMSQTDPKAGKRYRENLIAESLKVLKRLVSEGGVGVKGEGGYPEAQFFLANMFGTGQLGLQVDHEKAYQLYMQASKANHPAATYRTAVCNELGAGTRKEVNRAVLFYRKAAMLKDTAAMYKLAMILILGNMGQQINHREGVTWLRRAALQADEDNPHALHELAMIYEDPRSLKIHPSILPPSIDLARDHYTQAAQLGYAPSMHKLGVAYEHGHLGCPVDPKRSIAWLSRAAEKGDPEAALALSGWFLTGAEGVLKQDDAEAYLWARKAANKGLATAEYALACESHAFWTRGKIGLLIRTMYVRLHRGGNRCQERYRIGQEVVPARSE
jgi:TPR repeat protein